MSWSNDEVFSDLHKAKIFPTSDDYELEVQAWFWSRLDHHGHCYGVFNEVEKLANNFKRYAKSIWDKSKRSVKTIRSSNKDWLAKSSALPTIESNCMCDGCTKPEEPVEEEVFNCLGHFEPHLGMCTYSWEQNWPHTALILR